MSGKTYTYYDFLYINIYVESDDASMSLFIDGNGIEPITASGLYVAQGAVNIPLTCLGQTTFVIPPGGRLCDSFDATSLTLPGTVIIPSINPVTPWVYPKESTITTSEASFTLTVNPSAGDTVTLHIGDEDTVLTFTAYIPGTYNMIIGEDLAKTIDNIVEIINDLPGAIYLAESSSYTVTVTAYSDLLFHITTSIATATVTGTEITISYLATAHATLPLMYSTASIVTPGALPMLNINAEATTGIGADVDLPLFSTSGLTYPSGTGSGTSDNNNKIALLMYPNAYINELAAYLFDLTGTNDEIALQIVRWVANNITCVADVTDTWSNAITTLVNRYGDCEDGAILQASLMLNAGVEPSRVRVYIGTYSSGATSTDHAWVEYLRESDNQWVTLDWTEGSDYWHSVYDLDMLPTTYPGMTQNYITASEHITSTNVVSLADTTSYINSLRITSMAATIPLLTIKASGQNFSTGAATMPKMSVSATRGASGDVAVEIPLLAASGTIKALTASLSSNIPRLTITATGTNGNRATMAKFLPVITVTGNTYQIKYGTVTATLPILTGDVSRYEAIAATLAASLPMPKIVADGRSARNFSAYRF